MSNRLPLPPDMQHLIEKRDGKERRGATSDADADAAIVPADEETDVERRSADRRSDD